MIQNLKENEIFVFGSNLAGRHAGGAAKQAKEIFGAIEGQGTGLQGQSYAFPTLDEYMCKLHEERLRREVQILYIACETNPDKIFLLTAVGTGIAGYKTEFMKGLFTNPPANLVLPEEFK